MRIVSVLKAALLVLAVAIPLTVNADPEWQRRRQSPKYLLLRSMTVARRYAISAVIIQRLAHVNDGEVEMKMEQDTSGRTRFTIWQPTHMRGLISLDDGINWYTYMPNHKRVMKQESPRVAQGNPAYQIYLADENYTWKLDKGSDIASCPIVIVSAIPKAKGMLVRRYYLDSRTSLMLQMETVGADGKKTVQLETRSLAYLKESPKLPIPGEDDPAVKTRTLPPPERFTVRSVAKERAGFNPIIPEKLPYGFIVKTTELVGPPDSQFIAIRLTDGLVTETVYQWKDKPSKKRGPFDMNRGTVVSNGIRMRSIGDMPSEAAKKLLQAFVTKD